MKNKPLLIHIIIILVTLTSWIISFSKTDISNEFYNKLPFIFTWIIINLILILLILKQKIIGLILSLFFHGLIFTVFFISIFFSGKFNILTDWEMFLLMIMSLLGFRFNFQEMKENKLKLPKKFTIYLYIFIMFALSFFTFFTTLMKGSK